MPEKRRRFPTATYLVVLGLIGLVALAPLLSVFIAGGIASATGCTVDEGSSHPCVIAGTDWGETLYTMFVMGWFMFLTIPLGAIASMAWLITLIVHRARWKSGLAAVAPTPTNAPIGSSK